MILRNILRSLVVNSIAILRVILRMILKLGIAIELRPRRHAQCVKRLFATSSWLFQVTVADKFFLGGPLNLRGFEMRGVGPASDGNAVGGTAYWAAGLHFYSPLPLREVRCSEISL